jgi:hypothetical protein
MPIFVALVLTPTLTFYFYALVQFWLEANRRRHSSPMKVVQLHGSRVAAEQFDALPERVPNYTLRPVAAEQLSRGAAHAKVAATCHNDRLVMIPSPTGRLAAKRAAKG